MFNMKFMPFYTFYSERQLSSNINEAVEIFSSLETQGLVVAAIAWHGNSNGAGVTFSSLCQSKLFGVSIVDGGWSVWGNWSTCSKSCGQGVQERQRFCNSPAPANGGQLCLGPAHQTLSCNQGDCPGEFLQCVQNLLCLNEFFLMFLQ